MSGKPIRGKDMLAALSARGISIADVRGYSVTAEEDASGKTVGFHYAVTLRDGRSEAWREDA